MTEEYRGSGGVAGLIFKLVARWSNVPAAIARERNARYRFDKRRNGPLKQVRTFSRRGTFLAHVNNTQQRRRQQQRQQTTLVPSGYTNRHNKAAVYIHWPTCKHMRLQVPDKC